jgi:predicted cation transporter
MIFGLTIVLLLVLFLPFTVKNVEHNLEAFLFVMGLLAATISQVLDGNLIIKALKDPLHITFAVLIAGLFFRWCQRPLEKGILRLSQAMPFRLFLSLVIIILGLVSSIITAIIAAIVLTVVVSVLRFERKSEIRFVVLACFSIGLGAVLTPIGEPLSTIAISKLNENFFYLLRSIGFHVIPAVFIFGILAALLVNPPKSTLKRNTILKTESYKDIIGRAFNIYLFVMGLTLLGAGFEPFIEKYLLGLSPSVLYWINIISAILDNATLAAAEISSAMDASTIRAILLGLLISGGMLIPGNIPNIIAAQKLNITSREWASFGVPVGLLTMLLFFFILQIFG